MSDQLPIDKKVRPTGSAFVWTDEDLDRLTVISEAALIDARIALRQSNPALAIELEAGAKGNKSG